MARIFDSSEIIGFAVKIEENGYAFYHEAARLVNSRKAKEVLIWLAGEEKKHIAAFHALQKIIGEYQPSGESFSGEYEEYVKALVDENVFTKDKGGEILARMVKTGDDAVSAGLGLEKDSIIFFQEMKKYVPPAQHQQIDELIRQERIHIIKLKGLKNSKD